VKSYINLNLLPNFVLLFDHLLLATGI